MNIDELIKQQSEKIMNHRNQILEDFCTAYLASFPEKEFEKLVKEKFKRLEMVIQMTNEGASVGQVISFRLKRGRLPKTNKILQ
jgi:pheromone shutdown protein TraB